MTTSIYDKAFKAICDRFKRGYDKTYITHNFGSTDIWSFKVDVYNDVCAHFDNIRFVYVYKQLNGMFKDHVTIMHDSARDVPTKMILHAFFDTAKEYDVVIGRLWPIKILSKGETLEHLAIEHDLGLKI